MLLTGYREEISRPTCNNSFQSLHGIAFLDNDISEALPYLLLPKNNCRKCGQPTCIMFASLATEGIKGSGDCPEMAEKSAKSLRDYLGRFRFD